MNKRKSTKFGKFRGVFAGFLVFVMMMVGLGSGLTRNTYAEPTTNTGTTEEVTTNEDNNTATTNNADTNDKNTIKVDACKTSMGALGWVVCPMIQKVSEAVDWLYDKIEDILLINPIETKDGSPIYEIWKYCLGVANVVFIIFLLIVIYSQITGWGITNYGIKKALPKLIVMAIMVNLSFLICSLAVDVSNIVGNGLRGLFESVEMAAISNAGVTASDSTAMAVSMAEMYSSMAGGAALAIGAGTVAFELGTIWLLIPTALGAIVAVATGLITIALRQAVVVLLVMIAPLAFVANILPNTEGLFQKWKKLLIRMLVFYPLFSLLFGASSLAGFAIIASAKDGFWVILGTAVQIFPLFFSWKLMQMSGTFLGSINTKLRGLAAKPLASSRAFADSMRQQQRLRTLERKNPVTPSARLMQYMSNRQIAREEEIAEMSETVKMRGRAYAARKNYKKGDIPSREGEAAYERQARNMEYSRIIERHQNNMNRGFGMLEDVKANATEAQKVRLAQLDLANVRASDSLKMEKARGEKIEYENAAGFHRRMEEAVNVHFDDEHSGNSQYKKHSIKNADEARARYNAANDIMEGDLQGVHFAAATAAQSYDTQRKIVETKMGKYFEYTPPTKDVEYRLGELTKSADAIKNIDSIIAGLRVLNQRGDTDILKEHLDNVLSHKVQLGSHASQALASFLMFEVKDSDPWLRRFGKYINLETASVYNKNKRQVMEVTYDEYVKGYRDEPDPENPGHMKRVYARKSMKELMEGTSIDNIERTALSSYDNSLIKAFTGADGKLDFEGYKKRRDEIDTAFGPAFISANLKYLSGSEQITNAVKSKTGYGAVQKEDGTYEMQPIWENDDYKKTFAGHIKDVRKWYQGKTLKYLQDQTPSQILGLRSDYFKPLMEHLGDAYMESKMDGWSDEYKAEHKEIMDEWAELQTRYGDLSTEEARENYNIEVNKLKRKMAGAQFRQLLDSKGKLNQIYRTRRSGAANNAKDWVREWLDLDNELQVTMKLENDKRRLKQEYEKMKREKASKMTTEGDPDSGADTGNTVYTETDRASFVNDVEDLWYSMRDEDDDAFYEDSLDYLKKTLGGESFIVAQYERFRKDDPYADSHMMKEYILDLLNDPDNY